MKYVNRIYRCAAFFRSEHLIEFGINGQESIYLFYVCKNPGISQDQLSKKIYVNKSNVARKIAVLQEKGYVNRTVFEGDKRQLQVFPTQKALDIFPKVQEVLFFWNQRLIEDLSEVEQASLFEMLDKIKDKAINLVEESKRNEVIT